MWGARVLRPTACVVLVAFTGLTLQPLTAAAQLPAAPKRALAQPETGEERYSRTLVEIHEILKEVSPRTAMPQMFAGKPGEKDVRAVGPKMRIETERGKPMPGVDVAARVKALRAKLKELRSFEAAVDEGFKATEKHIRDRKLPAEILARHEAAVAEFEKRKAQFAALAQGVEAAAEGKGDLPGALAGLGDFMAKYPNQKTHTPTDPNNLPWGSPKPVTRAPYTSPSQFRTSRLFGETVKVAQAGSLSGISLPNTALPVTPNSGDLAATEDAQITQSIRDLAATLGNNPVKIYNWVRNNVAFVPSYGSIQGSDTTLQTKRGNSFDTASLLIALLRAANIPARYVYGTIEVPADKAMNWVGGVAVPQAALNLMGQGGIPAIGVAAAGQFKAIRLEHVWVEAYVDYVPSRGAVNRSANAWVPMDASFKQYAFTPGMEVRANVPLDTQQFLAQISQGATVSPADGFVQNLNTAAVQQTLSDLGTRASNYIHTQNPNATVVDVLGTQPLAAEARPILLGTLPYVRIATGSKFQVIPENLRWKFQYNLYASDFDRAMDSPAFSLVRSAPALAGKRITLSFVAATQADQSTLSSFLPTPHADGSPIQVSELPQSFPGYLIRLVPELRVDGEVVATGPASVMGSEVVQNAGYFNAALSQWEMGADNTVTVGEYIATGLDLQGTGLAQLKRLQDRVQATKLKIEGFSTNPGAAAGITKEDITGDLLYSGILSYFGVIDWISQFSARISGAVNVRMPSFGNFGAAAKTLFYFGTPRQVRFPAAQMDVDRVSSADVMKNGDGASLISFRKGLGSQMSAQEHLVPEGLFTSASDPNRPLGVSAVRALSVAGSQGQRIYVLNPENQAIHAQVLGQLSIAPEVKQEIANALAIGKEATVHEAPVTISGFTGVGYIVSDPDTGAGAYKISGGANGGWLILLVVLIAIAIAIAIPALTLATGGLAFFPLVALALSIANFVQFIQNLNQVDNFDDFNRIAARAFFDALFDIIGGVFARILTLTPTRAAEVEMICFWAAIMAGLLGLI